MLACMNESFVFGLVCCYGGLTAFVALTLKRVAITKHIVVVYKACDMKRLKRRKLKKKRVEIECLVGLVCGLAMKD